MVAIVPKRVRRNISPNSLANLSKEGREPQFESPKVPMPLRISEEMKGKLDAALEGQPKHINRSTFIEAMLRALFDRPSDLSWNDLLAISDGCTILQEIPVDGDCIRVWHDTVDESYVVRSSSGRERGETSDRNVAEAIAQQWARELQG